MDVMAHSQPGSVASPPQVLSGDWTADLLDEFRESRPDDGTRYEILDGNLLVSPSPTRGHQRMAAGLFRIIDAACPDEFEVYFAPLDWRTDQRTVLEPDILVVSAGTWPYDPTVTDTPLLVVEVASPSTAARDRTTKFDAYARFGVAQYWIAVPGGAGRPPDVAVYDLDGDGYRLVTEAVGDEQITLIRPLAVTVSPAIAAGAVR